MEREMRKEINKYFIPEINDIIMMYANPYADMLDNVVFEYQTLLTCSDFGKVDIHLLRKYLLNYKRMNAVIKTCDIRFGRNTDPYRRVEWYIPFSIKFFTTLNMPNILERLKRIEEQQKKYEKDIEMRDRYYNEIKKNSIITLW